MTHTTVDGAVAPLFRPQVVRAVHGAADAGESRPSFSLRGAYVANAVLMAVTLALAAAAASLDMMAWHGGVPRLGPAPSQGPVPALPGRPAPTAPPAPGPRAVAAEPQAQAAGGPPLVSWARWPRREHE